MVIIYVETDDNITFRITTTNNKIYNNIILLLKKYESLESLESPFIIKELIINYKVKYIIKSKDIIYKNIEDYNEDDPYLKFNNGKSPTSMYNQMALVHLLPETEFRIVISVKDKLDISLDKLDIILKKLDLGKPNRITVSSKIFNRLLNQFIMLENIGFTIKYDIKGRQTIHLSRVAYLMNEGCNCKHSWCKKKCNCGLLDREEYETYYNNPQYIITIIPPLNKI